MAELEAPRDMIILYSGCVKSALYQLAVYRLLTNNILSHRVHDQGEDR